MIYILIISYIILYTNKLIYSVKVKYGCFTHFRSFYDHPTFFVVINFGSEIERINIRLARPTLPEILKVKVSSINSGYVTG